MPTRAQRTRVRLPERGTNYPPAPSLASFTAALPPGLASTPPGCTAGHRFSQVSVLAKGSLGGAAGIVQRQEESGDPAPAPAPLPEPSPALPLSADAMGSTTLQDPPSLEHDPYHGTTLAEVAAAMPPEPASVTFDFSVSTEGDPIRKATLDITQLMRMPRWGERDKQCPAVQAAWDSFYSALRKHEDGHVAINRGQFALAHRKFIGKASSSTGTVTAALEKSANAANENFDEKTDHGRKGNPPTTLDTSIVCEEKKAEEEGRSGERAIYQAKLLVNAPGDPFEQEAERTAEQVMRMEEPGTPPAMSPLAAAVQRKCSACAEEEEQHGRGVQRREADPQAVREAPPLVSQAARSGGRPLDPAARAFLEPRFGHDFSRVRVHADGHAAEAARSIHARAYTLGEDIVFSSGAYSPGTAEGRKLLAHELTHVVQQGHAPWSPPVASSNPAVVTAQSAGVVQRDASNQSLPPPTPVPASVPPVPASMPPAPGQAAPGEVTSGLSEEDMKRLLMSRTTLAKLPPLGEQDNRKLEGTLRGALTFDLIQQRNQVNSQFFDTLTRLGHTSAEYRGREPSSIVTELRKTAERDPQQRAQLEQLEPLARRHDDLAERVRVALVPLKVKNEQELVHLVTVEFPDLVAQRGKQIALSQLEQTKELATKERERFAPATATSQAVADKQALRAAAEEITNVKIEVDDLTKRVPYLEGKLKETEAQAPAPADAAAHRAAVDRAHQEVVTASEQLAASSARLERLRKAHGARFPILHRLDPAAVVKAGDDELANSVEVKASEVIKQSEESQQNLRAGKLEVWQLPPVLELAKQDLGVAGISELDRVIALRRIANEESKELAESALHALQYGASILAMLATGGTAALLLVVAAGATLYETQQKWEAYSTQEAAKGAQLDPDAALIHEITAQEPSIVWMVTDVVFALVDLKAAASAIRSLRPAARALMETRELAAFIKSVEAAEHLPAGVKERLISNAKRQVAAAEGAAAGVGRAARRFTEDGHEVVATLDGVRRCSPPPCPLLRQVYPKQLREHSDLAQQLTEIEEKCRRGDLEGAAEQAKTLDRALGDFKRIDPEEAANAIGRLPGSNQAGEIKPINATQPPGTRADVTGAVDANGRPIIDPVSGLAAAGQAIPLPAAQRAMQLLHSKLTAYEPVAEAWKRARQFVTRNEPLSEALMPEMYRSAQRRFWDEVRGDSAAVSYFESYGFRFYGSRGAPLLESGVTAGLKPDEIRLSLDHILPKATGTNWEVALSADNLRFLMHSDNRMLQNITARHASYPGIGP